MMIKKLLLTAIFLFCGLSAFAQVGERYVETQGGYSICPPRSWEIVEFPGQPNKMFVESVSDRYPAMMTFGSGSGWQKTLEQKFQEGLQILKSSMPGYRSINTVDFTANNGLVGKKHIYAFKANEYNMRGIVYTFLSPAGSSVSISCGALSEYGERFDEIFDESVATLEFIR